MTDLEQQLADHLRRRAAEVTPWYDLEAVEHCVASIAFLQPDERPSRRPLIAALVGTAAAALVADLPKDLMKIAAHDLPKHFAALSTF